MPADAAADEEEEDDEELYIFSDVYSTPRGRCLTCADCPVWTRRTGAAFAHRHCGRCGCPTNEHADLGGWLRDALGTSKVDVRPWLTRGIPIEAYRDWSLGDARYFLETNGAFNPVEHGRAGDGSRASGSSVRGPLCSVICPTQSRRHPFHPLLYECYSRQSYEPRELIVIDTGAKPSPTMMEYAQHDRSVVYRWFKDDRWSIGLKRNLACFLAKGEVIAHFDDDDIYAKDYLVGMVGRVLGAAAASPEAPGGVQGDPPAGAATAVAAEGASPLAPVAATLASWHVYDTREGAFRFLTAVADKWIYGWGFTFVYTRTAWEACGFPDINVGEDYEFMLQLKRQPSTQVLAISEDAPICSHTYHPGLNISGGESDREKQPIGRKVPSPRPFAALLHLLTEAEDSCRPRRPAPEQRQQGKPPGKPARRVKPNLTAQQALDLMEELIAEFCTAHFQRELIAVWEAYRGDPVQWLQKRQELCLPIQIPIVSSFGFEASRRGVHDSVTTIQAMTVDLAAKGGDPEVSDKGEVLAWLVDPAKLFLLPPEAKARLAMALQPYHASGQTPAHLAQIAYGGGVHW